MRIDKSVGQNPILHVARPLAARLQASAIFHDMRRNELRENGKEKRRILTTAS